MNDENQVEDVAQTPAEQEKMLSQTEVNSLIGRAKAEAQEKARRQAEQEFQQKMEQLQAEQQIAQSQGDPTQELNVDQIYQQVHERFNQEMQQRQLEQEMSRVADAYQQKMSQGKGLYEDFDDVVKEFNPVDFPQIVYLVSGLDNAADVIYELSKNPQKLATIDYLAQRSPQRAHSELLNVSQSIAANKAAQAEEANAQTNMPLDRLQSSNKTSGNGNLSISDLKKQPWLRG